MNTRRKVSCEGIPFFNVRKLLSYSSLLLAYFPALSTSNHSTDGDNQDLEQVVVHFGGASRIVDLSKGIDEVVEQGGHSDHYGIVTLL